jgi:hypothetical protein
LSTLLRNEFKSNGQQSKPNSVDSIDANNNNKIQSNKNSLDYNNDVFESEDEVESLARPMSVRSGTIGTAIGAVVMSTTSTTSIKSMANANKPTMNSYTNPPVHDRKFTNSFTSIIPELFDSNNNNTTSKNFNLVHQGKLAFRLF